MPHSISHVLQAFTWLLTQRTNGFGTSFCEIKTLFKLPTLPMP